MGVGFGVGAKLLVFQKMRFLMAASAISVAVIIMYAELGFFYGVLDSQTNITELVRGQLVVMHKTRTHLNKWNTLSRISLQQIEALPQVKEVIPIYKGGIQFTNLETNKTSRIIGYAFRPDALPLKLGNAELIARQLKQPHTVMFDSRSRAIYGDIKVNQKIELDGKIFRVGGFVKLGPNLVNDGTVILSDGDWLKGNYNKNPIMGVVRLKQGSNVNVVKNKIEALLLAEAVVFTPGGLKEREVFFTIRAAPIGIIFGIGLLAGIVTGISICYQVLYNTISDNTKQFATLKAMGFSNIYLLLLILEQAILLSVFGFIIGLALSFVLYDIISTQTALIIQFTWLRSLFIFSLTTGMCIVAGFLAVRRITRMQPAELF